MSTVKSDIVRDVKIHRLRNPHDPLVTILIATPAPCRRSLRRRQGDRVTPRVVHSGLPVRIGVGEDTTMRRCRLVELVGIGVEVAAVRLIDFVELAVCPASAGCVVA